MKYQDIFTQLWLDYSEQNPHAKRIHDLLLKEDEPVRNDHIALRTFNDPRVCKEKLAQAFLNAGYEVKNHYNFEQKKLSAFHLEHSDKKAPLVFISELRLEECSQFLQDAIKFSIDQISLDLLNHPEKLAFSLRPWKQPSYEIFKKLSQESEYAAWTYVHGYRANHFTIAIHDLKKYNTIEKLNDFIKANGYTLNTSGGEIKGTPEQLLEQSSTMAEKSKIEFQEGIFEVPTCFYEFARRYEDKNGKLYTGFIAASADKIFESTNL